jgi:hypothetical protein
VKLFTIALTFDQFIAEPERSTARNWSSWLSTLEFQ